MIFNKTGESKLDNNLLREYAYGLVVLGVPQVDAIHGQNGVADEQRITAMRGLAFVNLRDQNGHAVFFTAL